MLYSLCLGSCIVQRKITGHGGIHSHTGDLPYHYLGTVNTASQLCLLVPERSVLINFAKGPSSPSAARLLSKSKLQYYQLHASPPPPHVELFLQESHGKRIRLNKNYTNIEFKVDFSKKKENMPVNFRCFKWKHRVDSLDYV